MGEKTKKPVGLTGGNLFNFDTSLLPEGVASQVERKRNVFTRERSERLHPPLHKATVDKQARLPEFGEDVKKTCGFE